MCRHAKCFIILAAFLFSACSFFPSFQRATPEQKSVVVSISADYVMKIAKVDERGLGGMVLWNDYLAKESKQRTKASIHNQMLAVKERFPMDKDHPLLLLQIDDVDVDENDAEITFRKAGVAEAPKLWVKMVWVGSGWLVTDDSIFGKNGAIEKILSSAKG